MVERLRNLKHRARILAVCMAMLPIVDCIQAAESQHRSHEKQSASTAQVTSGIGFASHEKYVQHFRKHGREFGRITSEEYLRMAQQLRDRPARVYAWS